MTQVQDPTHGSTQTLAPKRLALPFWMSPRRRAALRRLLRFVWQRCDGKLCMTAESCHKLSSDTSLWMHEIDRALDDLYALKACDIRHDGLTDHVTLHVREHDVAWN